MIVENLSDNNLLSSHENLPLLFGGFGWWEHHMWHLSTIPCLLAKEALCLEQTFFVEVAWALQAGIWHMPVCSSQICVVDAQCGINMVLSLFWFIASLCKISTTILPFKYFPMFVLSQKRLLVTLEILCYSLCIGLIKAHIFWSKFKLPKCLIFCEAREQYSFPKLASHPSEMLLKPVLI